MLTKIYKAHLKTLDPFGVGHLSKIQQIINQLFRLKEKKEDTKPEVVTTSGDAKIVDAGKKTLWQKVVHECQHYYSGFKLLFLNVRVSSGIVWKILQGQQLTRRESKQVLK